MFRLRRENWPNGAQNVGVLNDETYKELNAHSPAKIYDELNLCGNDRFLILFSQFFF